MSRNAAKEILCQTSRSEVRIRSFCAPQEIRQYKFDSQFRVYDHYKSLFTKRNTLEEIAQKPDANVVLALVKRNHIIGYGVLAYPEPGERWVELGPQIMMEVRAIEVARSWREARIAPAISRGLGREKRSVAPAR